MQKSSYNEEYLPDLLPLYYKRIFPHFFFYRWLCYGEPERFHRNFTLNGHIYIQDQSFNTLEEFAQTLCKHSPIRIDVGALYRTSPRFKNLLPVFNLEEKELVFDINMTNYDDIRTCCIGADVCKKCWKFTAIACKIIDTALREDFGFNHILWVFSGRRGIHCWVADKAARILDEGQREAVAEYFQVIQGNSRTRKVKLPPNIPHSLQRALSIIDKYFSKTIIYEQDILGTDDRLDYFLSMIDDELRPSFEESLCEYKTSKQRWKAFKDTFQTLQQDEKISKSHKHLVEEMKLYYAYPRLDINVTKSLSCLSKAPFCVHPKTGLISVPFNPRAIDYLDPGNVPTVSKLVNEIRAYDVKTKVQKKSFMETNTETVLNVQIKDYKNTSLFKCVIIFSNFIRNTIQAEYA